METKPGDAKQSFHQFGKMPPRSHSLSLDLEPGKSGAQVLLTGEQAQQRFPGLVVDRVLVETAEPERMATKAGGVSLALSQMMLIVRTTGPAGVWSMPLACATRDASWRAGAVEVPLDVHVDQLVSVELTWSDKAHPGFGAQPKPAQGAKAAPSSLGVAFVLHLAEPKPVAKPNNNLDDVISP